MYSALPSLLEFRDQSGSELPKAGLGSIEFLIGTGYLEGFAMTRQKLYLRKAANAFGRYLLYAPEGKDAPLALYYRGNCLLALGDYALAALAFLELVQSPGNDLLPAEDRVAVIHNLAIAYYHSNQMEVGRHWFGILYRTAKEPGHKSLAAAALVESYARAGMFDKVRPLLADIGLNTRYWSERRLNLQLLRTAEHMEQAGDKGAGEFFRNLVIFPKEDLEEYAKGGKSGASRTIFDLPPATRLQRLPDPELQKLLNQQIAGGEFGSALPTLLEARVRLQGEDDGEFAKVTYLLGLAYLQAYRDKQDPAMLTKAAQEFNAYVEDFPAGPLAHYAVSNFAECLGMAGDYAGSVRHMQTLLDPAKPYASKLAQEESNQVAWYIAKASFLKEDWAVCIPVAETLLALPEDPRRTQAAAMLAEAYFAMGLYSKAATLAPHFGALDPYRMNPRLNFLFMKSGDTMVETGDRERAATFYSLAMTPAELSDANSTLRENLKPKLSYYRQKKRKYRDNFPVLDGKALERIEGDWDTLERHGKTIARLLDSKTGNFSELLRWRRAHNFAKLGRHQEAFTGLVQLLEDFPSAKLEDRENYLYQAIVEADKLWKSKEVIELAERYLGEREFRGRKYEVSVLYTKPLLRKARGLLEQARKLHRDDGGGDAWESCKQAYTKLWDLCLHLALLRPQDPNARYVVYTTGVCWMDMEQAKFGQTDELARVFETIADKDFKGESPSLLDGIHYWLGMAYTTKGKHSEAFGNFAMARKLNPSGEYYRDALFRLGECAKRMGKYFQARSFFNEFMKKYPDNRLVYKGEAYLREMAADE